MPIIDLQRRLVEIGAIRIGEKKVAKSGKSYPAKLETFRLTAPHRHHLDQAADLYGGEVVVFAEERSTHRWQLYTTTDQLPVMVPPPPAPGRTAVSQWYEQWGAGGCTHRCDGQTAYKVAGVDQRGGVPCACLASGCDPAERTCSPVTRLSIILPDLDATGTWRLNTSGWNAAEELAGIGEFLAAATAAGYAIPATLTLEPRTRRKYVDGEAKTFNFVVPVLTADLSPAQARAIQEGGTYDPRPAAVLPPNTAQIAAAAPRALGAGDDSERASAGRVRSRRPIEDVVPATGVPLPTRAASEAADRADTAARDAAAFILSLPEQFRGAGAQADRHTLYALAAGGGHAGADASVSLDDLKVNARSRVVRWAHAIAEGRARIVVADDGARSIVTSDGEVMS